VPEFGNFWSNHDPAIRLERIILVVFLVIIFGNVKLVERSNFGDDRVVPDFFCADFLDDCFGNLLLFLIMIEDGRAVLCPDIIALAVKRGRVVDGEEYGQEVL